MARLKKVSVQPLPDSIYCLKSHDGTSLTREDQFSFSSNVKYMGSIDYEPELPSERGKNYAFWEIIGPKREEASRALIKWREVYTRMLQVVSYDNMDFLYKNAESFKSITKRIEAKNDL